MLPFVAVDSKQSCLFSWTLSQGISGERHLSRILGRLISIDGGFPTEIDGDTSILAGRGSFFNNRKKCLKIGCFVRFHIVFQLHFCTVTTFWRDSDDYRGRFQKRF